MLLRPCLGALAVISVQGCQLLNVPPAEGPIGATAIEATPPAVSGYPALQTVPPRPQLSYPVEQRRTIAEGLISDRENARYTSQLVRYRSGRTDLPPPPRPEVPAEQAAARIVQPPETQPPAPPVPVLPPFQDRVAADDGRRALSEAETELDDGSLSDFIREMVRDTGPPEDAQPILPPPPPDSQPAAAAPAPRAPTDPERARSGLFGWLRGVFSDDRAGAAEPAPEPPAPEPDEPDETPAVPSADGAPAAPAPYPEPRPDPPEAVAAVALAPDAPKPGPARSQLERLIEPPPPAPGRSAPAAE